MYFPFQLTSLESASLPQLSLMQIS
uniref:Uncharacterized protein n=1 Tax=Anguilla anguilla TaxID=7936 RepID=A0A0E9S9P8_ANGAN